MLHSRPSAWRSRFVVLLVLALSPALHAQTITLKNSKANSCQYSSLVLSPGGDIEVDCALVASGGQINFATVSATANSTAPVEVAVTRSGNFGGDTLASAVFTCSSPASYTASFLPAASGTLNFFGNTAQRFTVIPGTLPAGVASSRVSCSLRSTSNNAEVGPNSVFELTVLGTNVVPGTVGFSNASSTGASNGAAVGISVARTGSTSGSAASVSYSCSSNVSGYAPAISPGASGTLSFSGDETKVLTVTPGALPSGAAGAVVTCTLSNPNGTGLGATTSHALSITGSGGGGTTNCTPGAVELSLDITTGEGVPKANIVLKNGETASVAFTPNRFGFSRLKSLLLFSSAGSPPFDGWQASISLCPGAAYNAVPPGNEATPDNCRATSKLEQGVFDTSVEPPYQFYECKLERDRTYYLNVRWVNPDTGGPGCPTGTCGITNTLNYR